MKVKVILITKKPVAVFILLLLFFQIARSQDTLTLNRQQSEAIFLKENLLLLAEKLEIHKSEALVLQAGLWPNPTITFDQVNFWATASQTNGQEILPPLTGSFGSNQQFGFGIEQLILTAGKRKKLIAIEQVGVDQSRQYFEDLLRNLKIEFRNGLTDLQFLQSSRNLFLNQFNSLAKLTQVFQKQMEQGNIPKGEFIRLKALELEFAKKINELNKEIHDKQKELKLLMRLPADVWVVLTDEGYLKSMDQFKSLSLNSLLETSKAFRPDLKIAQLNELYFNNLYRYEKAQRTPNLNLISSYDRGGNFMLNFVGFGVALDLPIFNRNKGNIQFAGVNIEQSKILYEQKILNVENEIVLSYQNLIASIQFFESIEPGYENTLDELLISYTKNFTNRNLSLLEFIDFLDAYLENKRIILEAGKEVNERAEELNYALGIDLII